MKAKKIREFIKSLSGLPERVVYNWKPTPKQSRRKDQGWIHLSDLKNALRGYNEDEILLARKEIVQLRLELSDSINEEAGYRRVKRAKPLKKRFYTW